MEEIKTFNKTVKVDYQLTKKIIDEALANGRFISTEKMEKDVWLQIRNVLGIGGSEVAVALGISEYESSYSLWKKKISDEIEIIDNNFMEWGRGTEAFFRDQYIKITGRKVKEDNKIRIHPEHNCLFVNLDGVVMDGKNEIGMIEIKSTVRSVYKSWSNNPEECPQGIPLYHYCQIQHALSITGFGWCDLVVGILDARKVEIRRIERDEEYIALQNKALVGWWTAYVMQNVPPPKTVAEFAFSDPIPNSVIEADNNILDLHETILKKQEKFNKLKKDIDGLKDEMKTFIGDNEGLVSTGTLMATYKRVEKKECVVPKQSYRELRLKKPKE
jgi:putative phage-type endonuclease